MKWQKSKKTKKKEEEKQSYNKRRILRFGIVMDGWIAPQYLSFAVLNVSSVPNMRIWCDIQGTKVPHTGVRRDCEGLNWREGWFLPMSPVWRYSGCTSKWPAGFVRAVYGSKTRGSRLAGVFCHFFSRKFLLFSNFLFLSRLSCWLLTSRLVSRLFFHCSCLPGLSLWFMLLSCPYHPTDNVLDQIILPKLTLLYPISLSVSVINSYHCIIYQLLFRFVSLCLLACSSLLFLWSPFALGRPLSKHPSWSRCSLFPHAFTIIIMIWLSSEEHATSKGSQFNIQHSLY